MTGYTPGADWYEGPPPSPSGLPSEVLALHTVTADGVQLAAERVWHRPLPPLPTLPGYYLPAGGPGFGATVVVELLNRPDRQWVDAGDRTYLSEDQVRDLLPLARLARVDDLLAEVAQIDLGAWADAREDLRKGLDELARRYGVDAYEVIE
jgi:hypothetical protein